MFVSATECQNNFGRYLQLSETENVIITRNGKRQAVLVHYPRGSDGYEAGEPIPEYGTSPRKEWWIGYEEFMAMTAKSENRYELIDGIVYLMASPGFTHQKVLGSMYITFVEYFKDHDSCDAFVAPFDIKLVRRKVRLSGEVTDKDINVVQPDLLVLCDYADEIDEEDRYQGTPALAVEILSPSSRSMDRIRKLDLYMDCGIGEFWLVDAAKRTIAVYSFADNELESETLYAAGDTAESIRFPGLRVPVDTVMR